MNKNLCEYLIKNDNDYDYDAIVKDFWNTGFYSNKLELVGAIVAFGHGQLTVEKIIEAFNHLMS
jgi:hypothetical protein